MAKGNISYHTSSVGEILFYGSTTTLPYNISSTNSNDTVTSGSLPFGRSVAEIVCIALVAVVLMALTIGGNLLVILAYRKNRRLRSINNLFLVSLACSDFVIGVVSMSLYPVTMITGTWYFGEVACDIWLCIDYTLSMASVANLMLICLDRYFSVTRPFTYRRKRTRSKAKIAIVSAWIFSMLLWSPAILIWPRVRERTVPADSCYIQFFEDPLITSVTAILAFYLPVVVMIALYWRIYMETRRCHDYLEYLRSYKTNSGLSSKRRSLAPVRSSLRSFSKQFMPSARRRTESTTLRLDLKPENGFVGDLPSPNGVHRKQEFPEVSNDRLCEKRSECDTRSGRGRRDTEISDSISERSELGLNGLRRLRRLFAGKIFRSFRSPSITEEGKTSESEGSPPARDSLHLRGVKTDQNGARSCDTGKTETECYTARDSVQVDSFLDPDTTEHLEPLLEHNLEGDANNRTLENNSTFSNQNNDLVTPEQPQRPIKIPSSERKAARTLSAILLAFIVTWLPYNVCVVYSSFCRVKCGYEVPKPVWSFAYYLCYINSTVNPFCFACCNRTFRHTFANLLGCSRTPRRPRSSHCWPRKSRERTAETATSALPSSSSSRSISASPFLRKGSGP